MKKLLLLSLGLLFVSLLPRAVAAHVLIADQTGTYGAILHIMPGDDPVAGEVSQLFFDISGVNFDTAQYDFVLQIRTADDEVVRVPASRVSATGVQAEVVFASRGVYSLELFGQPKNGIAALHFVHTKRITRGAGHVPEPSERYTWAEAGLVAAVMGGLVILVLCINRRAALFQYMYAAQKRRG